MNRAETIMDDYINELRAWEEKLQCELSRIHPYITDSKMEYYITEIAKDPKGFAEKEVAGPKLRKSDLSSGKIPRSLHQSLSSLFFIRSILKQCVTPLPQQVPIQNCAHVAWLSFYAGLNAGMTISAKIEHDDLSYRQGKQPGKGDDYNFKSVAQVVRVAISELEADGKNITEGNVIRVIKKYGEFDDITIDENNKTIRINGKEPQPFATITRTISKNKPSPK
jgi:hypothetical protein